MNRTGLNFQDIISRLQEYWKKQGCIILQPYDLEKGAGTFNPATFFGSLSSKHTSCAYVEPCRRPADGRYGENPNRLGKYYQFQVIIKPSPADIQELYLNSLKAINLDPREHDVRWIEDDWQSPTLGASGVGWEIWLDGMEITQFTYFQNMAGYTLKPITVEITYGLERIAMYSQKVDSVYDLRWNDTTTYGDLFHEQEVELSKYYFENSNVDNLRRMIGEQEEECAALCKKGLHIPAYESAMRVSQYFNMLEARGAISVSDRTNIIAKIRNLAKMCAKVYIEKVEPEQEEK
ncbi:glycyl-tRNA synthetase alpha chain [Parelusimicrobium proximum]|uniref:glycine--tRNA ligase subunit alpha n=1 Tax=Parelusimicrobium proximum TaxID=3228953 RepID=UPI003D163289